jgi:hypothetical protein
MVADALPPDCLLVCKLHPSREERGACEAVLTDRLDPTAFRVVDDREHSTPDLLGACEVAVAVTRSMALVDAIVAARPIVAIAFPDLQRVSDRNHPAKDFDEYGTMVHSVDELNTAIRAAVHTESPRRRARMIRGSYITRFLNGDGHAARRVGDLIERLASDAQHD